LTAAFAVLEYLDITWACHTVFINRFLPLSDGTPEYEQFPDVLNGSRIQFIRKRLEHGFASSTIIRENTNFYQSMSAKGSIGFLFNSGSKSITTDHDNGVKVVSIGAVFFALGRGQLNLGHADIIGHEGKNENQNKK
jgi:hypothetical protein